MSVSLAEVARAARARHAPLAAESAGYLVLAVADQVAPAPRTVRAGSAELGEDGGVRLLAGEPASDSEAERQLRALLAELLQAASSLTPALVRASRQVPLSGLAGFVAELESALIPVNRAAGRRALARLARETSRAREQGLLQLEPEPELQSDSELQPEPEPEPSIEVVIVPELVAASEPEPSPEPLVETRPEPLAARRSSVSPEPLARTPRIGTLITPSVSLEAQDPGDVTDPMPSTSEEDRVRDEAEALDPEPDPEPLLPEEIRPMRSREPKRSELDSLLRSFASADGPSEPELRRELKKIAGLDLTPPPATTQDP